MSFVLHWEEEKKEYVINWRKIRNLFLTGRKEGAMCSSPGRKKRDLLLTGTKEKRKVQDWKKIIFAFDRKRRNLFLTGRKE